MPGGLKFNYIFWKGLGRSNPGRGNYGLNAFDYLVYSGFVIFVYGLGW